MHQFFPYNKMKLNPCNEDSMRCNSEEKLKDSPYVPLIFNQILKQYDIKQYIFD